MLSTLKDRKFWTGMILGGCIAASMAVLQPINAAAPADASAEQLKKISGVLVQIGLEQRNITTELKAIKAHAAGTERGVKELKETTFNPPSTQPR